MIFYVWDEFNSSREHAAEIEADCAEDAAIEYAEEDSDGLGDGLYTKSNGREIDNLDRDGNPIVVEHDDGTREVFMVGIVEFEPVWGLTKREEKKP